jgi:hypothetical protein
MDVERYEGDRGVAAVFALTGGLLLCFACLIIGLAVPQIHTFDLVTCAAAIFLMGGLTGAAIFLVLAAGEAGASFTLDDQGITRHASGWRRVVAWRDLVRFEESCPTGFKGIEKTFGRMFLYGRDGTRLPIRFHYLLEGSALRARLEPRLAALREEGLRDLAKHGGSFRPTKTVGFMMMTTMVPIFLVGGLSGLDLAGSGRAKDSPGVWYFSVLAVAAAPLLAMLALELISRKLTLSPTGLALRSIFLRRSIPFSSVASIDVKRGQGGDGPSIERARIRAIDGQKIALDSSMWGYRAVVEIARMNVAAKACWEGVTDPEFV